MECSSVIFQEENAHEISGEEEKNPAHLLGTGLGGGQKGT